MADVNEKTNIAPPGPATAADLSAASVSAATKNLQAFAAEISEMSRQTVEHASETIEKLRNAGGLAEVMAIQSTYMREVLEHFMQHTRKFTELIASVPLEMSRSYTEAWSKSVKTAIETTEDAAEKTLANAERLAQPFRDS
jgi:hypothetical protein